MTVALAAASACGGKESAATAPAPEADAAAQDASTEVATPIDAAVTSDAPPPSCDPQAPSADQSNVSPTESDKVAVRQSFVAGRSGFLTSVELSLARCGGDATDAVDVALLDAAGSVLAKRMFATDAQNCSSPPSLQGTEGAIVDFSASCVRVEAKKTYRIELRPVGTSYRFGVRTGDGYASGALEKLFGTFQPVTGDLVFRTFVAE